MFYYVPDNSYIALDDSREYLARLEKKLNKLCESSAKNLSSKSLLASLSATRSHHQHNLLSCSASNLGDLSHEEEDLPKAKGILLNNSKLCFILVHYYAFLSSRDAYCD